MLLWIAAALVLSTEPPRQQPVLAELVEARELVQKLQFSQAIGILEPVTRKKALSSDELRLVRELLAYCQVAEGRRAAAELTYRSLLEADAAFELSRDSASPKVLEIFLTTKSKMFPADYVRVIEQPTSAGRISFSVVDPWKQVQRIILFERADHGDWRQRPLIARANQYVEEMVPGTARELEWYVELESANGVLAQIATREKPRIVRIPNLKPVPVVIQGNAPISPRRVAGIVALGVGLAGALTATGLHVAGFNQRQAARNPSKPPGDYADTARRADTEGIRLQEWGTGIFVGAGVAASAGVVLVW